MKIYASKCNGGSTSLPNEVGIAVGPSQVGLEQENGFPFFFSEKTNSKFYPAHFPVDFYI